MAINPLISLKAQAPDAGAAIGQGLQNAKSYRQNKLLGTAQKEADLQLDEATEMAEVKAIVRRGEGARVAFQQGGREGLLNYMDKEIEAGATVKNGRGMIDSQQFRDRVADPNYTDEQIVGQLDTIRDMGVRYNILEAPSAASMGVQQDQVQSSNILADGTVIMTMKSGGTLVKDATGKSLTGEARSKAIQAANEEGIRISGAKAGARSEQTTVGGQLGQYKNDIDNWNITRDSIVSAFPDIKGILDQTPGSSLSNGIGKFVSLAVGNTEGQDAQAKVKQLGAFLLQSTPVPKGSQSDVELANRKELYGQLDDPNISVPTKISLIENYFKYRETQAKIASDILNKGSQPQGSQSTQSNAQGQTPATQSGSADPLGLRK